jgi:MFS family permease
MLPSLMARLGADTSPGSERLHTEGPTAAYMLAQFGGALLGGRAADRHGAHPLLVARLLVYAISISIVAAATGLAIAIAGMQRGAERRAGGLKSKSQSVRAKRSIPFLRLTTIISRRHFGAGK